MTRMKIGIAGLGGTGSSVAEQLARMGITDFILVDHDKFEPSNLTRMYGSVHNDLKSNIGKTLIVARNLKSINPHISARTIEKSVIYQDVLSELRDRDVVFCCTDNDWSRSLLNRFSYQYFVPVVDMGTRIVVENHQIVGAAGRVSLVGPGMPCLWCSHHLDSERIRAESMDPDERLKLQKEQYVQGLVATAPSIISLNTTVSSMGVTLFLSLVSGFSKVPKVATDQLYDAMEGIVFTASPSSNPDCNACGVNGLKGLGDTQVISSFGSSP